MFLDNADKKMRHKSLRCEERVRTILGGMDGEVMLWDRDFNALEQQLEQ